MTKQELAMALAMESCAEVAAYNWAFHTLAGISLALTRRKQTATEFSNRDLLATAHAAVGTELMRSARRLRAKGN